MQNQGTTDQLILSAAFSCINGSVDLMFGDFNFRVSRTGILRLQNSTRFPAARPIEPEKLARWADDEDEIGSEPDSSTPTHPHLHFIGMVKRVPRENSDGETEEEDDPSKSEPKSWAQMDAELDENRANTPPPENLGAIAEEDEEAAATATESQTKKQKGDRPQILVSSATNEWVNSLIARGAALPDDATAEERLTYRYNLSQQRKKINKLQKSFNVGGSAEAGEDGGAQKQPTGKHRSRTRDMPPETMGATRKDLASDLNKQEATPPASVVPKTTQESMLQCQSKV